MWGFNFATPSLSTPQHFQNKNQYEINTDIEYISYESEQDCKEFGQSSSSDHQVSFDHVLDRMDLHIDVKNMGQSIGQQYEKVVQERDQAREEIRWLRQELHQQQQMYHQLLALYHGNQINQLAIPQTQQNYGLQHHQSSSDQSMETSSSDFKMYKGPNQKPVVEIKTEPKYSRFLRTISQINSQFVENEDVNQHEIEVNLNEIGHSSGRLYIRVDLVGLLEKEGRRYVKHLNNVKVPFRNTPTTIVTIPNMKIGECSHRNGKALFYHYTLMLDSKELSAIESQSFTTITTRWKNLRQKRSKIH